MPVRIPAHIPPVEPAPLRVGSFTHDGLRFAYEVHGEAGPTVVMQAGLGFSRIYFRPLAGALASRFRCVLLDSRGCGESQGPDDDAGYTVEDMAGDVLALLDHLGADRAWLYGHSLGSNVVVEAALRAPERVERLVLTSFAVATDLVHPFLRYVRSQASPETDAILRRVEDHGPALGPDGYPEDYGFAAGSLWTPHTVFTDLSQPVAWNMGQSERAAGALWGRESAFRITGSMLNVDQRTRLGQLEMPVLLFIGRYDQYAASTVPLARKLLPQLEVVETTRSNHHTHVEEPGRVAEAMAVRLGQPGVRLRSDVAVVTQEDPDLPVVLEDTWSRHRVALGPLEARILQRLGAPADVVADQIVRDIGDEFDEESVRAAVAEFLASLSAAAMLEEGLTSDEIERRQIVLRLAGREDERRRILAELVPKVVRTVPFYRDRAAGLGLAPEEAASEEGFRRLPPTTKADVRANFPHRMVPDGVDAKKLIESGELAINATSGSTDERLQVLFDYRTGQLPPRHMELWELADDEELDRGAIFTSPICAGFECHLGKSTKEERTRGVTLTLNSCDDPMSITDAEVRAILGEMREYQPRVLFVNPWYAVWLARRAEEMGLSLPSPVVVLSSYQYLTRRHRKVLAEKYGAKVFSYYGATDLGGSLIGVECARGSMHVREDHVHVELVPFEEDLSSILVTTHASPHMPLLRYEVGDVARPVAGPCSCNLGVEWRRFSLEGRRKDLLTNAVGRAVTTRAVDDVVGDRDLDFWSLAQRGARRYLLEAMVAPGGKPDDVAARLARLLGPGAQIDVKLVDRFSPERSMKFRQTLRVE